MPSFLNAAAGVRETAVAAVLARRRGDAGGTDEIGTAVSATTRAYRIFDAPSARAAADLPHGSQVALAIAGVDAAVAARDQSRINALLSECGCRLSSAFLVVSVSAAIAIDIVCWAAFRESPAAIVAAELLLAFSASGIGRFVGIAHARKTLCVVLSAIADRIDAEQQRRRAPWAV
jgi:hypothetical protein